MIYQGRPLDCQLYPFALMWDRSDSAVLLGIDTKCPFIREHAADPEFQAYAAEVKEFLRTPSVMARLAANPGIVERFQEDVIPLASLEELSSLLQPYPGLIPLTIHSRSLLEEALERSGRFSSGFAFPAVWAASGIFRLFYADISGSLAIFFEKEGEIFMPLPPLGGSWLEALPAAFEIMERVNRNRQVSRVENLPAVLMREIVDGRWRVLERPSEFVYLREELARLGGERYKSRRWEVNRFLREIGKAPSLRPFQKTDEEKCALLFARWRREREARHPDDYYRALLADAESVHAYVCSAGEDAGLIGRILSLGEGPSDRVIGYTFGYPLDPETFCVMLEVTDPSFRGASAYLFQAFVSDPEVARYRFINTMDDSYLPALARHKNSYRPIRREPLFAIVSRQDRW